MSQNSNRFVKCASHSDVLEEISWCKMYFIYIAPYAHRQRRFLLTIYICLIGPLSIKHFVHHQSIQGWSPLNLIPQISLSFSKGQNIVCEITTTLGVYFRARGSALMIFILTTAALETEGTQLVHVVKTRHTVVAAAAVRQTWVLFDCFRAIRTDETLLVRTEQLTNQAS